MNIAASIVLIGLTSLAFAQDDDPLVMRRACEDLVHGYAFYRDRHDAVAYADLFTEDAVLVVLGETYRGRDVIRKRLEEAANGPATRHMMSSVRIEAAGPGEATGISYATIWQGPASDRPVPIQQFAAVGEYHDRYRRTAEGWKIARREFVPVFVPAPG
jgi:uncharacterized protein (TIGR02246 family)